MAQTAMTIRVDKNPARQRLLGALYADRSHRPDLSLEEINEEIRADRRERRERKGRERIQAETI